METPGSELDVSPLGAPLGNPQHPNGAEARGPTLPELYTEAYQLAVQAVQEDTNGDHHTARLLYCEVCEVAELPSFLYATLFASDCYADPHLLDRNLLDVCQDTEE